jgi:hypothetical protein
MVAHTASCRHGRSSRAPQLINDQLQTFWAGKTSIKDGLTEAQKLAQPVPDEALRRA